MPMVWLVCPQGRSVADASTLPSLMEGRPHTAPSFLSRTASSRSSQRVRPFYTL